MWKARVTFKALCVGLEEEEDEKNSGLEEEEEDEKNSGLEEEEEEEKGGI